MVPLSHAEPGKTYKITWINGEGIRTVLRKYGIRENSSLLVVTNAGGDVTVQAGSRLAINEPTAFKIKVSGNAVPSY